MWQALVICLFRNVASEDHGIIKEAKLDRIKREKEIQNCNVIITPPELEEVHGTSLNYIIINEL